MSDFLELLDVQVSQAELGRVLGVTKQAISKQVGNGVLAPEGTLLDWLRSLFVHLRDEAAGRGGDEQQNLSRARQREAEANAQLKELQYHKEVGNLVPLSEIEPLLESWAVAARSETQSAVEKIVAAIQSQHEIEVDQEMVNEQLGHAFKAIADYPKGIQEQP
ncbi:MAG TPA: hypothetical protein ENI94_06575 [Gammaproteobacteria bacterium]|nr:hypothetical protein [Gammaproteobacteria bacterium]